MSAAPIVFSNARMVLAGEVVHGALSVAGGRIEALDGGATAAGTFDLEGDYLFPGLVEVHTDNLERHLMPRPKVQWAEMPALLAHDAEVAAAGITTVFDALGVGEADPESLRGSTWDTLLDVLDGCIESDLLRADHHLHVRCELPAPNTIELFEPFRKHPRLSMISLMDHTPGQRQWENIEVARVYYTGKKGWSDDKFDRRVSEAVLLQTRYAEPHRRHFVEHCRAHGIALASHDDTTVAHVEQAHAEGASMSEFPTTLAAARGARTRPRQHHGRAERGAGRLALGQRGRGRAGAPGAARHPFFRLCARQPHERSHAAGGRGHLHAARSGGDGEPRTRARGRPARPRQPGTGAARRPGAGAHHPDGRRCQASGGAWGVAPGPARDLRVRSGARPRLSPQCRAAVARMSRRLARLHLSRRLWNPR